MSNADVIARLGLRPVSQTLHHRRRIIISSVGWQKSGKSDFLLSCPKPLMALDYDTGMEELLANPRFAGQLDSTYRVDMRYPWQLEPSGALTDATVKAAKENVERFKKLYTEGVVSGAFRTVGIDNGHALLNAFRAARLGKNISIFGGVDAKQYGPVNTEFEELLKLAYDHDTNVVITHRYEDRFVLEKNKDPETGKLEQFKLKGYKDIKYVTQVHIEHLKDYDSRDLRVRIVECRQNNRAENMEFAVEFLDDDTCAMLDVPQGSSTGGTFLDVARAVFPQSTDSDWLGE